MMINAVKLLLSNERRTQVSERNRETITQLKFIGLFQPGEKINIRNMAIEPNNIFTPILRRIYGEGRDSTLAFLSNTIDRTFEIIQFQVVSSRMSDQLQAQNTVTDLIKAIIGLKNLQKTYRDDKLYFCELESLIETIHTRLTELQQQYPTVIKENIVEETLTLLQNQSNSSSSPSFSPLSFQQNVTTLSKESMDSLEKDELNLSSSSASSSSSSATLSSTSSTQVATNTTTNTNNTNKEKVKK